MISIKKLKSLPKWLYITLTAIALLFAAYQTNQYVNRPRDLGDKVIYLGKETYGCWFPLCASKPTNIYYFGTDLNEEELGKYFGYTRELSQPAIHGSDSYGSFRDLAFQSNGKSYIHILITVHDNPGTIVDSIPLKNTDKKNVISINQGTYSQLREEHE